MRRGLMIAAVLSALGAGIAGCGDATGAGAMPDLAGVPLVPGSNVLASVRRCDRGSNPYCAVQLVISAGRYADSLALLHSERDHLKALGWTIANADTGDEHAADSPRHKLHLLYATAALDLKDLDLGGSSVRP